MDTHWVLLVHLDCFVIHSPHIPLMQVLTRLGLDSTGTCGEPEVTTDTYLFNFIECDIVLRLPGARTKNWVTINIELGKHFSQDLI